MSGTAASVLPLSVWFLRSYDMDRCKPGEWRRGGPPSVCMMGHVLCEPLSVFRSNFG